MLKNISIILLLTLAFFSCNDTRKLVKTEQQLLSFINEQPVGKEFTLKLDTIESIKWDEMFIAGPYTDITEIKEGKTYNLTKLPNSTKSHDKYILIGFLNEKEAIGWIELESNTPLNKLLSNSKGYQFYDKKDCVFLLKK
ncbi:hypothetical protein [Joostella sp. CR20]|uniref:hypothetical protein n=1 Tax=Joostella sp. CR20 TaxID=2804312 RepID=UPI00313AAEF6